MLRSLYIARKPAICSRCSQIGTMANQHFFSLEVQCSGKLQFQIWLLERQGKIEPIGSILAEQLVENQWKILAMVDIFFLSISYFYFR